VYCLTPKRDTKTYDTILTELLNLNKNLAPRMIMSDFELASINAFSKSFPRAEQKGCFFHFSQALHRQLQQHPTLLAKYGNESDFSLKLRYLKALAFIPECDVVATVDLLMEDDFFVVNEEILHEY
jgi:hypothetical protein